jgi:hypothetical protein
MRSRQWLRISLRISGTDKAHQRLFVAHAIVISVPFGTPENLLQISGYRSISRPASNSAAHLEKPSAMISSWSSSQRQAS